MSLVNFELPEEFADVTYESILARILARVPDQYDKTEGGFIYDLIAPTALEAAELIQFWLALGIKTNFHMWAASKWLDYHAHDCGLVRKGATNAYVELEVVTSGKVEFAKGFIFCVPSDNDNPAIEFETTQKYSFAEAGTYTVAVSAVKAGTIGNVAADSIVLMKNPVKNVASITNPDAASGGVEAESDDSLRERIDEFYAGHGASYVGNKADYERWAHEVDGVGFAHCIPNAPIWSSYFTLRDGDNKSVEGTLEIRAGDSPNEIKIVDTSSTADDPHTLTGHLVCDGLNAVKLVIADGNGDPATQPILDAVEKYIFGTGHSDLARLAPIGVAKYDVVAPSVKSITLTMNAKRPEGVTVAAVKTNIVKVMNAYFKTLSDEENFYGELRYSKVAAILAGVAGLEDYRNLLINGAVDNIIFKQDELPQITTGNITLNEW